MTRLGSVAYNCLVPSCTHVFSCSQILTQTALSSPVCGLPSDMFILLVLFTSASFGAAMFDHHHGYHLLPTELVLKAESCRSLQTYHLVYSPVVAYLSAACHQLEAMVTGIGLSHHRMSLREFPVQGSSTVLKIVLSQTSNGHVNFEPTGPYTGFSKEGFEFVNTFSNLPVTS